MVMMPGTAAFRVVCKPHTKLRFSAWRRDASRIFICYQSTKQA